jgi:phage terminase Nu1 subunit (DNA packaging protein)
MTLPKEVGTEDLAKVLGLTPRGVGKLAEKKVLRRLARGSFDLCDCVQAYVAYRQQAALAQHGAGANGRARAALYLERARVARIQRETLEDTLVDVNEVRAAWTAITVAVKTRLLSIPTAISPRLVMRRTAAEAMQIVTAAIREALEDLSRAEVRSKPPPANRRKGDDAAA